MQMPDSKGMELFERIRREQLPTAPLLPMMYSDDIRQQVAQFKEHRLDAYLVKPITRRELFRAIERKLATGNGVSPHDGLRKLGGESSLSAGHRARCEFWWPKTPATIVSSSKRTCARKTARLTFVKDGAQAVDKATSNDYDLIFMDIQMPKKDGLAATRSIRTWESEHRANRFRLSR